MAKVNIKLADKRHFRSEEEKEFYKDLLDIYHTDYIKLDRDLGSLKIKLSKVNESINKIN